MLSISERPIVISIALPYASTTSNLYTTPLLHEKRVGKPNFQIHDPPHSNLVINKVFSFLGIPQHTLPPRGHRQRGIRTAQSQSHHQLHPY